jgi:CelD/BcsL family acetyltransferase involved in cellulose biosynthesis
MIDRVDLLHPRELDEDDARAWSALQLATPAFSNPLLGPRFAQAVGAVREDARVAIFRVSGRPAGFLPFHKRPSAFARPIGAPFCDVQALVCEPGLALDGAQALSAAGVRALRVNGLIDPYGLMRQDSMVTTASRRIVLPADADKTSGPSRNGAKNFRRYSQRLIHDHGALRLVAPERRRGALEQLLAWKSAQLKQSGLHDVLAPDWTRRLMRRLFNTRQDGFEGLMMGLYAGGRLVAGQFGVRLHGHYHPWIAAMDPALKAYSPGNLFQWLAIEAMPRLKLSIYELGVDGDHWKQAYAHDTLPVSVGLAVAAGAAGRMAATGERLYAWPAQRVATLGRLQRRLDHIAASELTLSGRTLGVIEALARYDRRINARQAG